MQWTPELIQQLERTENMITRNINHWVDSTLGRFVTEFVVDQFMSYSKAKRRFFKGFQGKFFKKLPLLTNILLCEKGFLCSRTE